jgi:putative transposase
MVTLASEYGMVMRESRMQGQLARPVWRGLGRNGPQQWGYRAPLPPYITYIPMVRGFMYLVAIMDWYSRYVVAWQLSNTLDGFFCLEALERALAQGQPDIFNTDQGAQFTALAFTSQLERAGIRISMDGRGRALDNVFVERLWRSVKYEHVYLYEYAVVPELEKGLHEYFTFYNHERPHQSLSYQTPAEVHMWAPTGRCCHSRSVPSEEKDR